MVTQKQLEERPLSYSSMKEFLKSPAHFIAYRNLPKKEPTKALVIGSLVDCFILTHDKWAEMFSVEPELNLRTKDGRAEYEEFCRKEAAAGITVVSQEDYDLADMIASSVLMNKVARSYIDRIGETQKKINFQIEGLPFVAKLDAVGDSFICDLKTSVTAEPNTFSAMALKYDYDLQCAVYLKAMNSKPIYSFPDYFFLVVEKEPPCACSVIKATNEFIEIGKLKLEKAIENFKFCMENNLWHKGYEFWSASGTFMTNVPQWALNKIEE